MNNTKIPGGFYLKARSIMNSAIMKAPPCARELWDYLLLKACFTYRKEDGVNLKRGQLITSIDEIREDLSWQIGWRREYYSRDQMKTALKSLRSLLMITTAKTPRGIIINICNYDYYQNPKNYEATNEATNDLPTKPPVSHQQSSETSANKGEEAPLKNDNKERINNIVEYLNLKTGKSFKSSTPKTKDLINARLAEGYSEEDFKRVIGIKTLQWSNTEQEQYLRPITLFGAKFESYLNERTTIKHNGQTQKKPQYAGAE